MREREPEVEALRTKLARKFTTLADEVNECFEDFHIGGGDYVVELLAPEGVSTGGGKQALQHLRLRPRRKGRASSDGREEFSIIVAGSVNPIEKWAELRTFEAASITHDIRFDKAMDITAAEWEQFLRKAEVVLHLANIETGRVGPSPDLLADHRRKKSFRKVSPKMLVTFLVIMALATGVVLKVIQTLLAKE